MTGTEIGALGFGIIVLWLDVKSGLKGGREIATALVMVAMFSALGGLIGYVAGLV